MSVGKGVPSSKLAVSYFNLCWTSWAGWPSVVMVDRETGFMGEFADNTTMHGVELDSVPLEAPWQLGKAERRGAVF